MLVFKKNRDCNNILFIDASPRFSKLNNANELVDEDIKGIINVYKARLEIKRYSAKVELSTIRDRDYNLSINKYIDIFGIENLMKNYNFNKYKISDISKVMRFKDAGNENFVLLRVHNAKVIEHNEENLQNKSNYLSIFPDEDIVSVEYLEYFFSTHISQSLFNSISNGLAGNRISIKEFKGLEIPIPEVTLQKQIVKSYNQITDTINELKAYRSTLVNNPKQVNDLSYKLEELNNAIQVNNGIDRIRNEISRGETLHVEFKRDFSSCDEKIIRTIYAFLNTEGGKIYIGVEDDGTICGLEENEPFENADGLILRFTNKFRDKVPEYLTHSDVEFVRIDNKSILILNCSRSSVPVFRKVKEKSKFYVRKNGSSQCIEDVEEVLKFVQGNFSK